MIVPAAATGGAGEGLGHGGDTAGYHTLAFYFGKAHTTIAVIVDSDAANANDLFGTAVETTFASAHE
jgi:hypothetical protein